MANRVGIISVTEWKQERPPWCPHQTCLFRRRAQDAICCGELPEPAEHEGDLNTHRICLSQAGRTDDYEVNKVDLEWARWIFDAIDGKETSWLSKRGRV